LLAVHEAEAGLPDGGLRIVPVLGTARAVLQAASFADAGTRVAALALDVDALADQVAGEPERRQACALVALAAAAAGVPLIALARDAAGTLKGP
jgi:citrate lyase beta subunit